MVEPEHSIVWTRKPHKQVQIGPQMALAFLKDHGNNYESRKPGKNIATSFEIRQWDGQVKISYKHVAFVPFRGTIALTPAPVSAYLLTFRSNCFTKNCTAHVFTVLCNRCMEKVLVLPTAGVASWGFWIHCTTLPKWEDDNSECHLRKHWYHRVKRKYFTWLWARQTDMTACT